MPPAWTLSFTDPALEASFGVDRSRASVKTALVIRYLQFLFWGSAYIRYALRYGLQDPKTVPVGVLLLVAAALRVQNMRQIKHEPDWSR